MNNSCPVCGTQTIKIKNKSEKVYCLHCITNLCGKIADKLYDNFVNGKCDSEEHINLTKAWRIVTKKQILVRRHLGLEPRKKCFYRLDWGYHKAFCMNFGCMLHVSNNKKIEQLFNSYCYN